MSNKENVLLNENLCTIKESTKRLKRKSDPGRLMENEGKEDYPWKVNVREFFS
jgi:hypothetical protein